MQVPVSAITANEICYASYLSQASLEQKGMSKLSEKLLEVAFEFFQGNHFNTLLRYATEETNTRSISCFHDNLWTKLYLHVPSARQSLINDDVERRLKRLEKNNEIRTCISLCTVVLSQALLKGYNAGVLESANDPAIFAITPETVVLNLLAEVDADCTSLQMLASTKAINALVLRFFERGMDIDELLPPRGNSPLHSKWLWTSRFQGKLELPAKREQTNQRIRAVNQTPPRVHPSPVKEFFKNMFLVPNKDVNAVNVLYMTFPIPM